MEEFGESEYGNEGLISELNELLCKINSAKANIDFKSVRNISILYLVDDLKRIQGFMNALQKGD